MYFSAKNLAFINVASFWEDNVEVSDELHNTLMAELASGRILAADKDGNPITSEAPPVPELSKEQLTSNRMYELNRDYEQEVSKLQATYSITEISTWPLQLMEAVPYTAWHKAGSKGTPPETPFLSGLVAARNEQGIEGDLWSLVDSIIAKNDAYSPELTRVTAIRQAAEKALLLAKEVGDVQDIKDVTWSFTAAPAE